MNLVKKENKTILPEFPLANKAKLIISKEIQSQITYLHHKVGKFEWSGELLYSTVSGSIEDIDTFVVKAEGVFPMNKGTYDYTEYEADEQLFEIMDMYPKFEEGLLKRGFCHTHQCFDTFFSSTDLSELHDNAGKHNYYLSLIVNFEGKYCAKIAIVAESKREVSHSLVIKNAEGKSASIELLPEESPNKYLVLIDCDIEFEQDELFVKRVDEICSKPIPQPVNKIPVVNKNLPDYFNSRNNNSKTNQYSNKYSRDAEQEEIWNLPFHRSWDTSHVNDDLEETIVDDKIIDSFLRKILSTENYDLEDKKTFPKLIDGIYRIEKGFTYPASYDKYLKEVEERYSNNFNEFFKSYGIIDNSIYMDVVMSIGDYVDSLVPMEELSTYDDLYSDISNLMWSQK